MFLFKQKTAYEMRSSDWSSDLCSSDLKKGPYQISYGSLVPKQEECTNLLVPVCLSSSHIAFGSIRMEPVFMILGQSAALAASLAIDNGMDVQDVAYADLERGLLAEGQILSQEQ